MDRSSHDRCYGCRAMTERSPSRFMLPLPLLAWMGCSAPEQVSDPTVVDTERQATATVTATIPTPEPTEPPAPAASAELTQTTPLEADKSLQVVTPSEGSARPGMGSGSSSAASPSGPSGAAAVGGASVSGGAVDNAGAVVAGMAAGFRRCYKKGLTEDPKMKGSVRVTAKIGPNGEVLSATPAGGAGLSGSVISCVAGRVAAATFAPPSTGSATVVIPVTFSPN